MNKLSLNSFKTDNASVLLLHMVVRYGCQIRFAYMFSTPANNIYISASLFLWCNTIDQRFLPAMVYWYYKDLTLVHMYFETTDRCFCFWTEVNRGYLQSHAVKPEFYTYDVLFYRNWTTYFNSKHWKNGEDFPFFYFILSIEHCRCSSRWNNLICSHLKNIFYLFGS